MEPKNLMDMTAGDVEKLLGLTEEQMADFLCMELDVYLRVKATDAVYHECEELPDPEESDPSSIYNCSHGVKWAMNEIFPNSYMWIIHVEGVPNTFEEARIHRLEYKQRHGQD